jgi:hypothetical protein
MTPRSERNARLTGSTAAVLVALLALDGVTILFVRPLLSLHEFIGMRRRTRQKTTEREQGSTGCGLRHGARC